MLLVLAPGWLTIAASHFSASVLALGIHVPARLDPTARLAGWHQLGDAVGESRRRDPTASGFLMSDSYQVASELAFYVPGQPRVHNVNLGRRRNQYDVWGGLEELRGRSGLFVTAAPFARITDDAERAARTKEYWATHSLARSCTALDPIDVVNIRRDGEVLRSFSILRCEGFRGLPPPGRDTY